MFYNFVIYDFFFEQRNQIQLDVDCKLRRTKKGQSKWRRNVCPTCGSHEITELRNSKWKEETQTWEVSNSTLIKWSFSKTDFERQTTKCSIQNCTVTLMSLCNAQEVSKFWCMSIWISVNQISEPQKEKWFFSENETQKQRSSRNSSFRFGFQLTVESRKEARSKIHRYSHIDKFERIDFDLHTTRYKKLNYLFAFGKCNVGQVSVWGNAKSDNRVTQLTSSLIHVTLISTGIALKGFIADYVEYERYNKGVFFTVGLPQRQPRSATKTVGPRKLVYF